MELFLAAVVVGSGATVIMDIWALLMSRLFDIPSLNYRMVGRWVGHIPRGKFVHGNIADSSPVTGERVIGWAAHYAIGIAFAWVLLMIVGLDWVRQPTAVPALLTGLVTLAAPFLILQPGMGAGVAASKTPAPWTARSRSLMAHISYGIGLYLTAAGLAALDIV